MRKSTYSLCGIEDGISCVDISYTCIKMVNYTFTPILSACQDFSNVTRNLAKEWTVSMPKFIKYYPKCLIKKHTKIIIYHHSNQVVMTLGNVCLGRTFSFFITEVAHFHLFYF